MLVHRGTQELCTERLKLRKFVVSDAAYMHKNYACDEKVTKFLSWEPYKNLEEIEVFLTDVIRAYMYSNVYHWAIEIDGKIIGSISTISIDEKNCNCEIGYCIGYDYWNRGITSEALSAVIKFLFSKVAMHRITAKHDIENPSSGKVMKKCSMTYEGKLRQYYLRHDGTYSDALVYSILKNEYVQNHC